MIVKLSAFENMRSCTFDRGVDRTCFLAIIIGMDHFNETCNEKPCPGIFNGN